MPTYGCPSDNNVSSGKRERDWSNLYVRLYSETEKESNTQTVSAKNRSLEMS